MTVTQPETDEDQTTVHHRTCPLCEAACGLEITVKGSQVVRIRGDRDNPFSNAPHERVSSAPTQEKFNVTRSAVTTGSWPMPTSVDGNWVMPKTRITALAARASRPGTVPSRIAAITGGAIR